MLPETAVVATRCVKVVLSIRPTPHEHTLRMEVILMKMLLMLLLMLMLLLKMLLKCWVLEWKRMLTSAKRILIIPNITRFIYPTKSKRMVVIPLFGFIA